MLCKKIKLSYCLLVISLLLLFLGCSKDSNNEIINKTISKQDYGEKLITTEGFISKEKINSNIPLLPLKVEGIPQSIRALVVPHHGLAIKLAAEAISLLADNLEPPSAVIIMGPNHRNIGPTAATTTLGWQTFAGNVDCSDEIATDLLNKGLIKQDDDLFEAEHSIGTLIPLICKYLPRTPVLPIIFHYKYSQTKIEEILIVLKPWLEEGAVIICSIDFSHGLNMLEAEKKDQKMAEYLLSLNDKRIAHLDSSFLDAPTLLAALLNCLTKDTANQPIVLENTNAGRLLNNSRDEVTSYFTLAF